jgi:hypothetical protein
MAFASSLSSSNIALSVRVLMDQPARPTGSFARDYGAADHLAFRFLSAR